MKGFGVTLKSVSFLGSGDKPVSSKMEYGRYVKAFSEMFNALKFRNLPKQGGSSVRPLPRRLRTVRLSKSRKDPGIRVRRLLARNSWRDGPLPSNGTPGHIEGMRVTFDKFSIVSSDRNSSPDDL
jgi:hypothetical protein